MIVKYKVSEFIDKMKAILQDNMEFVDIIGEVVEAKLHSKSGHVYFKLKEDSFSVTCVCWKNNVSKYKKLLQDGVHIKIRAKPSMYKNTNLYLSAYYIFPYGEGNILQYKKELEQKLREEGIFDKKRDIPSYPLQIGIITSKSGAAIQDILVTLKDKLPCRVILSDVNVQGEESVPSIIKSIKLFNDSENKVDVLIITRGGGSGEDLFHFNDEDLVRSIYASAIPVITAIGHEIDSSLSDLAADRHRHTPTAAVDFLPNKADLRTKINYFTIDHKVRLLNNLESKRDYINLLTSQVKNPKDVLRLLINTVHDYKKRSYILLNNILNRKSNIILFYKHTIKDKINVFILRKEYLINSLLPNKHIMQSHIDHKMHQLKLYSNKIDTVSSKVFTYQNKLNNIKQIMLSLDKIKISRKESVILSSLEDSNIVIDSISNLKNGNYQIKFQDGLANVNIKVLNMKKLY